ncbi:transcriptional coactivator Hfi1/Transcriptional adapter 1 [Gamsiella multidivaricata]|uniref:transcriptional coactivator Hfi1/Transcriptional adapter 1 n=1 Tax=Gamsiella multidivaricata TaxID=101098 RepID=UPI00221FC834|nr:transcriptional coactivator Hfi1/Transcriptional adapter 1 [Gamsiella multidivaricata]KAI7827613.1 transcriptional coactivator Hfi1/Transcriptional adapter 1 [Gamsiella multidivaricata]
MTQPPPSVDKDGRQDVLLLKQQLAEALGENGPSYWQALTDFVSGKLNRQEFDFYANLYLSRKNAPLHNQFILANIHNAQKDAPPPSKGSVGWGKGKRGKDGKLLKEKDPKRRKIKNQVLSLGKTERERIKALKHKHSGMVKQKMKEHRVSKPMAPTMSQQALVAEYNRGANAPLCFDSKELPDFESMKDRMTAVALENGLVGGIQEGAVELMLHALEVRTIFCFCM